MSDRRILYVLMMLALASLACAVTQNLPVVKPPTPIPSYTPAPTLDPEDHGQAYDQLATAAAGLNTLPNNVSNPGGVPLLPDANGALIFAYMKSVMSGNQQRELTGSTLFPLVSSATIWITMIVIVSGIRFVVNSVMFLIRIILWIIDLFLRFVGAFT